MGNEAPEAPRAVVRVQVAPTDAWQVRCTDYVPADDRAASRPVRVLEDRWPIAVPRPWRLVVPGKVEPVPTLEVVPAEVGAPQRSLPLEVDLLEPLLADVADRDPAAVEREAPWVPEAEREDLVPPGPADERVAAGHAIGLAPVFVRVDPQQLSKQLALVLGVLGRVVGSDPVSGP